MGTRCWSGGGREALSCHKGQGSQADLSLPSDTWREPMQGKCRSLDGAWDSVRKNEMTRELARAKESVTSPRSSEVSSGDGEERRSREFLAVSDDCQGVLIRLEGQGSQLTIVAVVLCRRPRLR